MASLDRRARNEFNLSEPINAAAFNNASAPANLCTVRYPIYMEEFKIKTPDGSTGDLPVSD